MDLLITFLYLSFLGIRQKNGNKTSLQMGIRLNYDIIATIIFQSNENTLEVFLALIYEYTSI